jgi:hypothetical protein
MKMNKVDRIEERDQFLFVNGNTIYCSNGNHIVISKKDRQEAKKRKVTDDQLKIICYHYLTKNVDIDEYVDYLKTLEDH